MRQEIMVPDATNLNDYKNRMGRNAYFKARTTTSVDYINFIFSAALDTFLVRYILEGNVEKVTEAIRAGANVNAVECVKHGYTPILYAAMQSKPEIIDALVQENANVCAIVYPDAGSWCFDTAIKTALDLNNVPVAKAILKHAPDLEKQPWYKKLAWYYKERVSELRLEIQQQDVVTDLEVSGAAKGDPLDGMLYRLQYGGIIATGVLSTFAASAAVYGVLGIPASATLIAASVIGMTKIFCSGWESAVFIPKISDLTQGCKLLLSDGVMETITKICNASVYNPLKDKEYSYEPVGEVKR